MSKWCNVHLLKSDIISEEKEGLIHNLHQDKLGQ